MIVSMNLSTYSYLYLQAAPLAPPALDICGDELALQVVMGGRDARAPVAMPAKGIPQQCEAPACGGAWPGLDEKEDRGRAKNKLDEFHVM